MKPPLFSQVSILGLGLIGGSIALELQKRKLARRVMGYNRSAAGRTAALRRKACHKIFSHPELSVRGSDLVILSTPVLTIPAIAEKIAPHLKPGAIVTDVGSTKRLLVKRLENILPPTVAFLGGHPIAGTERSGMESAELGLFKDRWWIFTPTRRDRFHRRALKKLFRMSRELGAKTKVMSPQEHDRTLALVSHLPHLVAYALVNTARHYQKGKALSFAAGGFRDFTRIAASSPQMWAEICLDNGREILHMMKRQEKSMAQLKRLIVQRNPRALQRLLDLIAKTRRGL